MIISRDNDEGGLMQIGGDTIGKCNWNEANMIWVNRNNYFSQFGIKEDPYPHYKSPAIRVYNLKSECFGIKAIALISKDILMILYNDNSSKEFSRW